MDMELSPLAREKLAGLGELSPEEEEKLKLSEELKFLLADYFTNKLGADELWLQLRKFKEDGKEFLIGEAQLRLIDAVSLGSNNIDFERCRAGILGCETLKEQNRYSELELNLDAIESLRQQYQREKETAFNAMKENIQGQVAAAAQQVARQTGNQQVTIDIKGSVEASVKASPQWKDFISKHEKTFTQRFDNCIAKIKGLI
jgi:hypothetical protein